MSRSRKKVSIFKDCTSQFAKRRASKKVRSYNGHIQNGNYYKKLYCSWNICDWKFKCFKIECLKEDEHDEYRGYYGSNYEMYLKGKRK